MPIIDIQRRLVEVGRIRMGEKRIARSGKPYPAKLETWRLTSRNRFLLEAAAGIYGGTVSDWEDQYQLITDSSTLDVAVIPGQALSQYMEHWGQRHAKSHEGPNPVVCLRRCDGATELTSDQPCVCKATGDDLCRPTTRVSVLLRRIPGIGVWRLDTRGQIAAGELIAGVEMLEMLTATDRPVSARLLLDRRSSVDGATGETRNFVVPVLDISVTLDEAMSALAGRVRPEVPAVSEVPAVASFSPVGELPSAPVGSVKEQVRGAGRERAPRRGGAEPIKATGRRPRTAGELLDGNGDRQRLITRIKADVSELPGDDRAAFDTYMEEHGLRKVAANDMDDEQLLTVSAWFTDMRDAQNKAKDSPVSERPPQENGRLEAPSSPEPPDAGDSSQEETAGNPVSDGDPRPSSWERQIADATAEYALVDVNAIVWGCLGRKAALDDIATEEERKAVLKAFTDYATGDVELDFDEKGVPRLRESPF